ncbi:hypothetical protein E2320_006626 [Naja naja]|nr:hypothetical protein E2320_006626 [Naja naja]
MPAGKSFRRRKADSEEEEEDELVAEEVRAAALLVGEKLQEQTTLVDDPFKIKSGGMVDMKKLAEGSVKRKTSILAPRFQPRPTGGMKMQTCKPLAIIYLLACLLISCLYHFYEYLKVANISNILPPLFSPQQPCEVGWTERESGPKSGFHA